MPADWIRPDWPAPPNVHALSTSRQGGVSAGVYASLNLGEHVGDLPDAVAENRRRVWEALGRHVEPHWLKQVHGTRVAHLNGQADRGPADAAVTSSAGEACVIMTADCLPVIFCDRSGSRVGAAHAGWRGLAGGVLEATINALDTAPRELLAWMGPAIGPQSYEVGDEVRAAFTEHSPRAAEAFRPGRFAGKWWCDLYALARLRLRAAGLDAVYGGGLCTYQDKERFFSFRRDGECGRMGTFIWRE